MSWKFVVNDDFDLAQLKHWKQFFEEDLKSAKEYLRQVQKWQKLFVLSNDWALNIAKEDIKISRENLAKVNMAIKIAEGRAEKYETKFEKAILHEKRKAEIKKKRFWDWS